MSDTLSMFDDDPRIPLPKSGKASFSARQQRAIRSYCESRSCRPQLSRYPTVYFTDKTSGETFHVDIKTVEADYDAERKEAAKERARQRRENQRSQQSWGRLS